VEAGVLEWLAAAFDLPVTAGGIFTSGGSMSIFSAIVAARVDRLGEHFGGGRLYVSAHAHHAIAKAARLAGFPADAVRVVPVDDHLRMNPVALARLVTAD